MCTIGFHIARMLKSAHDLLIQPLYIARGSGNPTAHEVAIGLIHPDVAVDPFLPFKEPPRHR
jgi:hypothetical protein